MRNVSVALLFLLAIACRTVAPVSSVQASAPRPLRVSLFPWIPDAANDHFQALIAGLTQQFEARHPDIALTITISVDDDPYSSLSHAGRLG